MIIHAQLTWKTDSTGHLMEYKALEYQSMNALSLQTGGNVCTMERPLPIQGVWEKRKSTSTFRLSPKNDIYTRQLIIIQTSEKHWFGRGTNLYCASLMTDGSSVAM